MNAGARAARGLVVLLILALVGPAAGAASASFPGRNGTIVYAWTGESAYRAGPTASSIRTIDPRSRRMKMLRDCPLLPLGYVECTVSAPRVSPDGRTIAFATVRIEHDSNGGPWRFLPGLGTMSSNGSRLEEHSTGGSYWRAIAWSPAGDRLLFERGLGTGAGFGDVANFLALRDGTELRQVTPNGSWAPDWSTRGEIAYARFRGPTCTRVCSDLYVARLGRSPRRLTHRGGESPSWSPHGTKLAFVRRTGRDRRPNIYIVGRDGRGLRRLTRHGGSKPVWSPDGGWIAFVRNGDLVVVRSAGGGLRRLLRVPAPEPDGPSVGSLDWQPLPRSSSS